MWFNKKPNLKHLHTFDCAVYALIPAGDHRKLDKKATKLKFIGYTETGENYKVWDEVKQRCYIRHDLVLNEEDFGKTNEKLNEDIANGEIFPESEEQEETTQEEEETQPSQPQLRRSERNRRPSVRLELMSMLTMHAIMYFKQKSLLQYRML